MENFVKKVIEKRVDQDSHRYFVRFGKGDYKRRFLLSLSKGKKIKIKGSFEWANDFVNFLKENSNLKYSGKILTRDKIPGKEGKKKAGTFAYDIENSQITEYGNAYCYLLNADSEGVVLKTKKSLPKPGKNEDKIDDSFCVLEIDEKYWPNAKAYFFWDLPDCKKANIEHELIITDIILPKNESDPVKIRELARRKGKMIRKIVADEKETTKEYNIEA